MIRNARNVIVESNGGIPVNKQDQVTQAIIIPAHEVIVKTTLAATVTIDTRTCTVTSSAGMTIGDFFVVTSTVSNRVYFGHITNIVGNDITVNSYFDYAFEAGQEANACNDNMAVDGSVTRRIFSLRASEPAAGIDITVDVTRVIFQILTTTTPILSDFGDIAGGLLNGIQCRKVDGTYENVFNVRTNDELKGIAYDLEIQSSTGVAGQAGVACVVTLNGDENMGVVKRIAALEDLELIVSDDLSGLIKCEVSIQGHATFE